MLKESLLQFSAWEKEWKIIRNDIKAKEFNATFIDKNSDSLLSDVKRFIIDYLGFGDFIFRTEKGKKVGRAHDLISLEEQLKNVPAESIQFMPNGITFPHGAKHTQNFS